MEKTGGKIGYTKDKKKKKNIMKDYAPKGKHINKFHETMPQ